MRLSALIRGLDVEVRAGSRRGEDPRICDFTEDSRTALPGSLFVARRGFVSDGRKYIADAIGAGAVAVLTDAEGAASVPSTVVAIVCGDLALTSAILAERFFGDPSQRLSIAAVTGTNGKTTTAHLVRGLLNACGVRCGLVGSVEIDDGARSSPAMLTTPTSAELSQVFAQMLEHGCTAAVMEASSHAIHQRRVAAIDFDVAAFTNLTQDHLDYHGTMDAYAAAKAELFSWLKPSALAVVNAEDPAHERMLADCGSRRLLAYPSGRAAVVGGEATIHTRPASGLGSEVRAIGPWGVVEGRVGLVGAFNGANLLLAIAMVHEFGLEAGAIERALPELGAPAGRLEAVSAPGDPFSVLVDFAHTPDALRNAIGAVRDAVGDGGRLRVVFGCGGDRDRSKRPLMGRAVFESADVVYITSDNPRTESASAIIDDILAGLGYEERREAVVHVDRRMAIEAAVRDLKPGDVLLIAGKGHEPYQLLPDPTVPGGVKRIAFDDREEARRALAARTPEMAG